MKTPLYEQFHPGFAARHPLSNPCLNVGMSFLFRTKWPKLALQRTAPGCHACCFPQNSPRSSHASPPSSLGLGSDMASLRTHHENDINPPPFHGRGACGRRTSEAATGEDNQC